MFWLPIIPTAIAVTIPAPFEHGAPQMIARFDGRSYAIEPPADEHRAANGDRRWHYLDPERGAITVSLHADGPPPLRDGEVEVGAAAMAGPYWITANCILTNVTASPQVLGSTFLLPVSDPAVILGGGAGIGILIDGATPNGAYYSTFANTSTLEFSVDGALVAGLFQDPFAIATLPGVPALIGPDSWGVPIPNQPVPAPTTTITVDVAAVIGSGDTAVFSFLYVVN